MDDSTSRTRQSSRRMASAKSSATTRRASPSRKAQGKDEQEVSPARWAGVAFVITAIVAAIVLGVVSPSDPGNSTPVAADASPTPEASVLDGEPPQAQPVIINPIDGRSTSEVIIPVTVKVPREDLPRDTLRLVIMRGTEALKVKAKPKTPGTFTIEGVGIDPGANELTAVLSTLGGGFGPRSEPVVIVVDENKAGLEIIEPKDRSKTYGKTILIEGTAPVGSEVLVINKTSKHKVAFGTVGSGGDFSASLRLKPNTTNKIEASTVDEAGVPLTADLRVVQVDGKPKVKVKDIEPVRRASLPAQVRIVVDVTDAKGEPMPEADVYFLLSGDDRTSDDAKIETNANGRAVWKPVIEPGSSGTTELELIVTVTSAYADDEKSKVRKTIDLK